MNEDDRDDELEYEDDSDDQWRDDPGGASGDSFPFGHPEGNAAGFPHLHSLDLGKIACRSAEGFKAYTEELVRRAEEGGSDVETLAWKPKMDMKVVQEAAAAGALCSCGGLHVPTIETAILVLAAEDEEGGNVPWCSCQECEVCRPFLAVIEGIQKAENSQHPDGLAEG